MDNGLTQAQAFEILTHLALYTGWPNVFAALPVDKGVFEKRQRYVRGNGVVEHKGIPT